MLVVEDDPASRKLVTLLLTDVGANVTAVGSAEEALSSLPAVHPELIVLDLILSRMSGLVLAEQLKSNPKTRSIVIVAVSSLGSPEAERVARSAGCIAYIRKPFDTSTFALSVAGYLGELPWVDAKEVADHQDDKHSQSAADRFRPHAPTIFQIPALFTLCPFHNDPPWSSNLNRTQERLAAPHFQWVSGRPRSISRTFLRRRRASTSAGAKPSGFLLVVVTPPTRCGTKQAAQEGGAVYCQK